MFLSFDLEGRTDQFLRELPLPDWQAFENGGVVVALVAVGATSQLVVKLVFVEQRAV